MTNVVHVSGGGAPDAFVGTPDGALVDAGGVWYRAWFGERVAVGYSGRCARGPDEHDRLRHGRR